MSNGIDLLGLDEAPAPAPPVTPPSPARQQAKQDSELIAYPSAYESGYGTAAATVLEGSKEKRYVVRCEGRWRVRNAPSLSSRVIGTVATGTVVIGEDWGGEIDSKEIVDLEPTGLTQQDDRLTTEVLNKALTSLTELWVKVTRLEAQEPMGVSEIRRDAAAGGIYCLRRNAMGYGLYQDDAEPLEGPMVLLPERLSLELRLDAQKAASERNEDVSLTWKLLGAAESLGRLFSDEVGLNNEDLKVPAKVRRPEDMFELKQRDQLKKAVASVRAPVTELVEKAVEQNLDGDLLAGLPKDLWRRFARLREALVTATKEADSFVVCPQNAGREEMTGPMPTAEPVDGSVKELSDFVALCERLERFGGWTCLDSHLRQEVIAFSNHAGDIQKYVRRRCKELKEGVKSPSSQGVSGLEDLLDTSKPPSRGAPMAVPPLLKPPPVSSCSVRTSQ